MIYKLDGVIHSRLGSIETYILSYDPLSRHIVWSRKHPRLGEPPYPVSPFFAPKTTNAVV